MTQIQITIKGLERVREIFDRAPERTINELSKAVQKSAFQVESFAKREAPVNKGPGGGNLRQNIRTNITDKLSATVSSEAPYSAAVHEGTRPHLIRPVNAKVLANPRTGEFFGRLVHHPGTRANPFMARAIERAKQKIEQYFREAFDLVFPK